MGIICATLCYLIKDDKVLMIYKNKNPKSPHYGKYNGLGGKFEQGETPEECAKREVYEESGITVNSFEFSGIIQFPSFYKENDWLVFIYTVSDFSGEIIESPEGSLEWVKISELLELPLWEGDSIFLPWVLEKRFFSAKFIYQNGHFKDYECIFY
jgi:8-oxo-dGTP diphosphatase